MERVGVTKNLKGINNSMNVSLEKLGVIVAIFIALAASIGNYYVMGSELTTLKNEVEILRFKDGYDDTHVMTVAADSQTSIASLTTEVANIKSAAMLAYDNLPGEYDDDWIRTLSDQNMNRIIVIETKLVAIIARINDQIELMSDHIEDIEEDLAELEERVPPRRDN